MDEIDIASLIDARWLPSKWVRRPRLGTDRHWQHGAGRHLLREVHRVDRDAVFGDFFRKLASAST